MKVMNGADEPRLAAFVVIDWGDRKHVWSLARLNILRKRWEHGPLC